MELIVTEDGSHTLFLKDLNETYHSRHGAIQESMHVFIKNGLRHFISISHKKIINLFEVGMGTGLNALLTAIEAKKFKCQLYYEAIEPYPVPPEYYLQLNYSDRIPLTGLEILFTEIHQSNWGVENTLSDYFMIKKNKILFEKYAHVKKSFDIIYYDAFAPGKQPDIWDPDLLHKAYEMLIPNGILITYCSQGNFKRNLKKIGFRVETLVGPPGKKEMVRATR